MKAVIIGIAGGTGAGKTTLAQSIIERLGNDKVVCLQHDSYYKDFSHLLPIERKKINFDHPDSLDTMLLIEHLQILLNGQPVERLNYDFANHTRETETKRVFPKDIIIVEGILVLDRDELRNLMNIKVFVDTESDIRFIRRLQRDVTERGRTMESVISQYLQTTRLMHIKFVEPTKKFADIIISGDKPFDNEVNKLMSLIKDAHSGLT